MPLIEISCFDDEFSEDESAGLISAVTDAVVEFTGERIRPHTWVVVREVRSGHWGIGGNVLGLRDVRALQAEAAS
jgi:4-oxalocrotonate tautomerase